MWPDDIKQHLKTVQFEDRELYIHFPARKRLQNVTLVWSFCHHKILNWWTVFLAERPFEEVLVKTRTDCIKLQTSILI